VYLNRLQVAAKLNVCLETLKRMEQRNQLHPIHLNSGVTRYRMSEIEKMMQMHEASNAIENKPAGYQSSFLARREEAK
jgi:predicted site-specific integrase-resolvase